MNKNDILKGVVSKVYDSLFELDTKTLFKVYKDIYKELISREDFIRLDDLQWTYEILKQKLIEEGVYNV